MKWTSLGRWRKWEERVGKSGKKDFRMMDLLEEYDFEMDFDLVARYPLGKRDESRLLVVDRGKGRYEGKKFKDLVGILKRGDCMVLNKSRVIPARLEGDLGGKKYEIFLLKDLGGRKWEVLIRKGRSCGLGVRFELGGGLSGELVGIYGGGRYEILMSEKIGEGKLREVGEMGIPRYILKHRGYRKEDKEDYQTVYCDGEWEDGGFLRGSVACPTAGRHLTKDLLKELEGVGVNLAYINLDISFATFQRVGLEEIRLGKLYGERYEVLESEAGKVNEVLRAGGRVVSVGTSSSRVLEGCVYGGELRAGVGETDLLIGPGHRFQVMGGLLTNFHMPRSSGYIMACTFGGGIVKEAYRYAMEEKYRFYSYGDGMLII